MAVYSRVRSILSENYRENLPYIMVGVSCGIACCLYAILFEFLERGALRLFSAHPVTTFIISPLMLILAFLLVRLFAPGAAGSGIPQVMTCIEPEHRDKSVYFLNLRIIVIKVLSSACAIFGGGAIGREGPSLQISASIGAIISRQTGRLGITIKSEQLLIAGAASGLAAAFNTPIGGIIYAIEELSLEHIRSYKTVLILSVLIAGLTAQLFLGNYLYLGYPQVMGQVGVDAILAVSGVSFLAGLCGAIFSNSLIRLSRWRKRRKLITQILVTIAVGLILASAFYFMNARFLFSGKETINFILFNPQQIGILETLFRILAPLLTSMTGVAGGIFAPSLSAGAALGGYVSYLLEYPEMKSLLGLAGMIGFLNGVTRTPITSFVLVQEMTDRHSAVFPMMLSSFFSSIGASLMGKKSFYERTAEELKSVS